jgi:hypothetical protein
MGRFRRIRAGRLTQEVVTWTIGVLVVVGLWVLGSLLFRHLGWP